MADGCTFLINTDLTEIKRHEEALRKSEVRLAQAQKMEAVGQLTGGVAHDFNNLLAIILGNIELLKTRLGPEDDQLNAIDRAATRGADLTQRLLAFSRQQPLMPKTIDLGAMVGGMSDLLARTLGETVEIKTEVVEDLCFRPRDLKELEQPGHSAIGVLGCQAGAAVAPIVEPGRPQEWSRRSVKRRIVGGVNRMERDPHQGCLDERPIGERPIDGFEVESGDAVPQGDVGCRRGLCLQRNDAPYGIAHRGRLTLEEQLTPQGGAVQLVRTEGDHSPVVPSIASQSRSA